MLKTLILRAPLLVACCALQYPAEAQTNQVAKPSTSSVKSTRPKVELAQWSAVWETSFGVSRDKFAAMGLSKLTVREAGEILFWVSERERIAEQKAMEIAKSSQFNHDCGRSGEDQAAATKVNLSVEESEHSSSEVLSGLRQRLRAIPDVQIVYEGNDADLTVVVIGMENSLTNDRKVGYEMAVTFTVPCKEWIGSNVSQAYPYKRFEGIGFYIGANIAEVIEPAVADIDAKYIENQRKSHAHWREYVSKTKK